VQSFDNLVLKDKKGDLKRGRPSLLICVINSFIGKKPGFVVFDDCQSITVKINPAICLRINRNWLYSFGNSREK
jgi:hypothetical protein